MKELRDTAPYAVGNTASKEAAKEIETCLTGVREKVFKYIVSCAGRGATGSEISEALDILPYTAKPRCTELRDAGFIYDSGIMRKNRNNRNETVWVAVHDWPNVYKLPEKKPEPTRTTGLEVWDKVLYQNPHLKHTFSIEQIKIIRADLEKAAGV